MAASQSKFPSLVAGFWSTYLANPQSQALGAAATWLAMQFVAEQARTLSSARLFLSAKTGTPAASELTCELYSDSSGNPGSSLESRPADSVPAANNWVQWSSFTTALAAGTPYWLVFKNGNASPASNFPTYQWCGTSSAGFFAGGLGGVSNGGYGGQSAPLYGWNKLHSTTSGASWVTAHFGVAGLRVGYSDGTYDGLPLQNSTRPSSGASADRATGKQEAGVAFSLPAGAKYNVRGVWMPACKFGSPGSLRFKLYNGTALLGTTNDIPAASVVTSIGDGYRALFPSAVQIDPSAMTTLRLTMCDANAADASTAGYNGLLFTFDADGPSMLLKPLDGTCKKTVTADGTASPPAFTDTNTDVLAFALLMDSVSGELSPSGGGSSSARVIGG